MTKEFVPYDVALELEKLGYNEPSLFSFYIDGTIRRGINLVHYQLKIDSKGKLFQPYITAPLYQQAFRWFREKYQLHSYIEGAYPWFRFYINTEDNRYEGHKHLSFEEVELACLIKLIEIVKTK